MKPEMLEKIQEKRKQSLELNKAVSKELREDQRNESIRKALDEQNKLLKEIRDSLNK